MKIKPTIIASLISAAATFTTTWYFTPVKHVTEYRENNGLLLELHTSASKALQQKFQGEGDETTKKRSQTWRDALRDIKTKTETRSDNVILLLYLTSDNALQWTGSDNPARSIADVHYSALQLIERTCKHYLK